MCEFFTVLLCEPFGIHGRSKLTFVSFLELAGLYRDHSSVNREQKTSNKLPRQDQALKKSLLDGLKRMSFEETEN